MTEQDVQEWIGEFGKAWVNRDPDLVVTLFSDTASYRDRPFIEPVRGRDEIRQYWHENTVIAQENVEFAPQVWAVRDDIAVVGWQASFTLKATGERVEADGIFRLAFSNERGNLQCTALEEWFHIKPA